MDASECDFYGSLTFPPPSASFVGSMNTDGNVEMFGQSLNSPMSSCMSPISQTSDSSNQSGFQNLNISASSDYVNLVIPSNKSKPYLSIIEQPNTKFRFRYISEMHGTHGSLTGQSTSRSKKTFPSVYLHNFYREATIRCSLFQIPKFGHDMATPHSHSLVIRSGNDPKQDKKDPHEVTVSRSHGYSAVFQAMGIIHTARRFIETELLEKLISRNVFKFGRALTALELEKLKLKAKKEAADMNLNQVSLCFEAFEQRDGKWFEICDPVYSAPINNMKCALTGELKITRLSTVVGSVAGNEDLFLFVEKVGKKNIKVRFYEVDDYENLLWEDWGRFSEADVHHQFAIALKIPPYKEMNIDKNVNVFVQLYRPGDDSYSDPVPFRYKPSYSYVNNSRKRPRIASGYNSAEIPESVHRLNAFDSDQEGLKQPECSISTEFATREMIQDVLLSAADSTTTPNALPNELGQPNPLLWFSENLLSTGTFNLTSTPVGYHQGDNWSSELDIWQPCDELATDSVSMKQQAKSAAPMCVSERFLMQMLKKIWPVVDRNNDGEHSKKRNFLRNLFKQAYYNGDSLLHIALKSDVPRFMERIWQIVYKFELFDLLRLKNDNGETCLHLAAALENPNEIRNFLRHGVDINDVDRKGDTPLHVAVAENRNKSIEALFHEASGDATSEIDLTILNDNGYTALHLAIKNSNLSLMKMIKEKAGPAYVKLFETVETKHGNSALHIAVETGADDIVKFMLENRCVDVNATNLSGHTALVLARAMKYEGIVQALMEHNAEGISEEDEDNTSLESTDSPPSDESTKTAARAALPLPKSQNMNVTADVIPVRPQRKGQFDDICLTQLCAILNANGKWKHVARQLGFQLHIPSWAEKRNPSKIMFVFSEALKRPKEDIIEVFQHLNETAAIRCMEEWMQRNDR